MNRLHQFIKKKLNKDIASRESILSRVQRNDPTLTELRMDRHASESTSLSEWDKLGKAIGKNTRLTEVYVELFSATVAEQKVHAENLRFLCQGLTGNRSIQELTLRGNVPKKAVEKDHVEFGPIIYGLRSFIVENGNLRVLDLSYCRGNHAVELLSRLLLQRFSKEHNLSLEGLAIGGAFDWRHTSVNSYRPINKVLESLTGYSELRKLSLNSVSMREHGCRSMTKLIANGVFQRLESLDIANTELDNRCLNELLDSFVRGRIPLTALDISGNVRISATGWKGLCRYLENDVCQLEKLYLGLNWVDDEAVTEISTAITAHCRLKVLSISDNTSSTVVTRGYTALANLLINQDCGLEELYLCRNRITAEVVASLARSLTLNRTLKRLILDGNPEMFCGNFPFNEMTRQDLFQVVTLILQAEPRVHCSNVEGTTMLSSLFNFLRSEPSVVQPGERCAMKY